MKKNILILIMLILSNIAFSQYSKEITTGLFVNFPVNPIYKVQGNSLMYNTKTENCFFMTLIQTNSIPNYEKFVLAEKKWSNVEKKKFRDTFLDNVVIGKLNYTGNNGEVTEIKIGNYYGRKISYNAINPATGDRGNRYSIILSIRDQLISIECWYLVDNSNSEKEKNNFFNSIKIN